MRPKRYSRGPRSRGSLQVRSGPARAEGRKPGNPGITDAQRLAVLTLRASGMTVTDIMEATGLGRTTVFKVLREARPTSESDRDIR